MVPAGVLVATGEIRVGSGVGASELSVQANAPSARRMASQAKLNFARFCSVRNWSRAHFHFPDKMYPFPFWIKPDVFQGSLPMPSLMTNMLPGRGEEGKVIL